MNNSVFGNCASCGNELSGKFCHKCGEKQIDREEYTIKSFLKQTVDVVLHFDSAAIRTIKYIFTRPGFVPYEYLQGRRVKYSKPVKLFVFVNIIYFLILNYIGYDTVTNPLKDHLNNPVYGGLAKELVNAKLAVDNVDYDKYAEIFYNTIYVDSKILLLLIVPMMALVLKLIFVRQKKLYYEHLIFSVYFLIFVLLFYSVFLNLLYYSAFYASKYDIFQSGVIIIDDTLAEVIMLIIISIYLFFAIAEAYRIPLREAALKTLMTVLGLLLVLNAYNFIMFLVVLYTT